MEDLIEKIVSEPEAAPQETPVETSAEASEQQAAEPQVQEDEDFENAKVESDSKGKKVWSYPESRARRLIELAKIGREFKEIFSGPEEAQKIAEKANAYDQLQDALSQGDPEGRLASMLKESGQFSSVLSSMLSIARSDPDLYAPIAAGVAGDMIDYFYGLYRDADDKSSKEAQLALFLAQGLDWFDRGAYKTAEELSQSKGDPRLSELEKQNEELRKQLESVHRQSLEAWRKETDSEIRSRVRQEIETALEPIKGAPELLRRAAIDEVLNAVQKGIAENKLFCSKFNSDYQAAGRTRSPEARAALVNAYVNQAKRIIAQAVPKVLKQVGSLVLTSSAEVHQKRAAAESRAEPSPGGMPRGPEVKNPKYEEAIKSRDVRSAVEALLTM